MLLDAGLGNQFWGFAILAAAHIINRMPSRVHAGKRPFEIWTGIKPGIGHLRIFGCPTHVLIPTENRRKLDSKSAQCIFIGYAEKQGTRVYNLYQPNTGKTITSQDVVFDEADNQKHHISEPATNQEVDTVMTQFDEDSNTRRQSIGNHTLHSRETSHPPEHMVARGPQQPISPPTGELLDSDKEMEDTIVLRAPVSTLQNRTRNTSGGASQSHLADSSKKVTPRRPQRIRKPVDTFKPASWNVRAMLARTNEEPKTLVTALASSDAMQWRKAWDSEVKSLGDNGTWVIENLPEGRTAIGCCWVFKIKEDGRYKARLVAKGYAQEAGVDYHETFAPVANFTTLRMLLALSAENDWEIEGMDLKTAFLHSELAVSIYMEIAEGLKPETGETGNLPGQVCRLVKTIYGLKQAPRAWYGKINEFFSEHGFYRTEEDYSLFVHENRRLIILLYVDDLILAASIQQAIEWGKDALKKAFEMTELGELKTFIGVAVQGDKTQRTLKISQQSYIDRILTDHGMENCATVATPIEPGTRLEKSAEEYIANPADTHQYHSAVGSLMYAMLGSRPDIAYAVGTVSKFGNKPNNDHWVAVKRIFRYLAGTRDLGILYGSSGSCPGFCDAD